MKYSNLIPAKFIKRNNRFVITAKLDDSSLVLAHCNNSGSMKTCLEENADIYLSKAKNPNRKTKYNFEMIEINGNWIGVNTTLPNKMVLNWIKNNKIPQLSNYNKIIPEYKYRNSRLDIYLEKKNEKCFVEIKNVTMKKGKFAAFPDAKTTRGLKHLNELIEIKENGNRAVMVYVIQRIDVELFTTADKIDPDYANKLREAHNKGVEIIPIQVKVSPNENKLFKFLDFKI